MTLIAVSGGSETGEQGSLPPEFAGELRAGEALLWWGERDSIDFRPLGLVVVLLVLVLGIASLIAPELWSQPLSELWRPLLVFASPVLLVLLRERANLGAVILTDDAIVWIPHRGDSQRLPLGSIRSIDRDLLRGGITLRGPQGRVHLPPVLHEPLRRVLSRHLLAHRNLPRPQDRVGFWPY